MVFGITPMMGLGLLIQYHSIIKTDIKKQEHEVEILKPCSKKKKKEKGREGKSRTTRPAEIASRIRTAGAAERKGS